MRGKGEGNIEELPSGRYRARFVVGYHANGTPRRISKSFETKKQAQAWLRDQATAHESGLLVEPTKITVDEWLDQYLASLSIRANTDHDYTKALKPVRERFGHVRLRELTPVSIQAALNKWSKERTPYQNRKTMSRLKAALGEATRLELLARNPAAPVRAPKLERGLILVWTSKEAAQLLRYARDTDHRLYAYVHVNLTTGLRREEMLGLRWSDVELRKVQERELGVIHVRQTCTYITGKAHFGPPKTRAGWRDVALDEGTVQVLQAWRERQALERQLADKSESRKWQDHDLVFPSSIGTAAAESRLAKAFRDLMEAAQVPRVRLYDLRHTYASIAYEKGVPVKLIGERMGHTNIAFTLQTYVHTNDEQRRAAAIGADHLYGLDLLEETTREANSASSTHDLPTPEKKEKDAS
ncbi:site-specific integrase [Deinococcus peraridilitoris]|uniref:Site-specific recombinase XerD n=1 Tax=Deinococcus peraridilitoris (strain DSM 19664 / LMG 22246 / CIP 109416 / KR-200) TaxID=937777 RepID=K9ZZJ4_DEIPD|nr:site-specific integrase [Deinococcus peraridilitoris]AFZ67026.1 site-specific recombinase XerD [Deinococcus peraridilitoris DSM 19664]